MERIQRFQCAGLCSLDFGARDSVGSADHIGRQVLLIEMDLHAALILRRKGARRRTCDDAKRGAND
jgi:hypothetical protein